jgi:hypothetical protein
MQLLTDTNTARNIFFLIPQKKMSAFKKKNLHRHKTFYKIKNISLSQSMHKKAQVSFEDPKITLHACGYISTVLSRKVHLGVQQTSKHVV